MQPESHKVDRAPAHGRYTEGTCSAPRPFRVHLEEATLEDLRRRLARARFTRLPGGDDWALGTRQAYLREVVEHWRTDYSWHDEEARLNAMDHFLALVDETELHFVRARGAIERPTPLLLLHGWPDSFDRYHRMLPVLGDFDVVVPSLPGFGFSEALAPRPHHKRHVARLLWRLMTDVLGHERFLVAGGDGGSVLAQLLAIDHPEAVIGVHLTDLGWHVLQANGWNRAEKKYLEAAQQRFLADGAYAMLQTTRPRSLTPALADSPVGLASWILDRFHAWCDGDLDRRIGRDYLLTNLTLYWATRTIGSSMLQYQLEAQAPSLTPTDRVDRPVGVALFPRDVAGIPPRSLAQRTLNVKRWTEMPHGGHFAALEEPDAYARELTAFARSLGGAR